MLAKLKLEVKDFRERLDNVFGYLEDENVTKAEPILNKLIKDYGEKDSDIQEALIILNQLKELKEFSKEDNEDKEGENMEDIFRKHWKYGLKRVQENNINYYKLTEIFGENTYVKDDITIQGESAREIIEDLELMLMDLKYNLEIIDTSKNIENTKEGE